MATISDPTALHELEPDPLEPETAEVVRYVEALRELAGSDPDRARRAAWNQIRLAGARAGARRAEAHETLDRLFGLGTPPEPALDGAHEGIPVTPTISPLVDAAVRALVRGPTSWLGKRFDARTSTGDNLLTPRGRARAGWVWPTYPYRDLGDGTYAAFRFRTYVGAGAVDPGSEVLKLDYDSEDNPRLFRSLLDELVQVTPGAYLGKVLLRRGAAASPSWRRVGYFALLAPDAGAAEGDAARDGTATGA